MTAPPAARVIKKVRRVFVVFGVFGVFVIVVFLIYASHRQKRDCSGFAVPACIESDVAALR
jgi:hypothetical protein